VTVKAVEGLAGLELDQEAHSGAVRNASNVYAPLIDALVEQQGSGDAARDVTVRGSPYDFRRVTPTAQFQAAVEAAFAAGNGTKKVTLLSHSLGCLQALYFLSQMSAEWKAAHVSAWVPLSPAYGGAVVDALQFVSGYNEGIPWLSGLDVRDEQRSYESNVWLLPSPALWSPDEPIFTTATRNYSAHDYEALFEDTGFVPDGPALLRRVANLTVAPVAGRSGGGGGGGGGGGSGGGSGGGGGGGGGGDYALVDPGVPVFPCYGLGVPTPVRYDYSDGPATAATTGAEEASEATVPWYDSDPAHVEMSDAGDGTVPQRSLAAGDGWAQAAAPFVLQGGSHSGILSDPALIARVLEIVANATTTTAASSYAAASD
jgi:uncharacterized membrane protein YgcG